MKKLLIAVVVILAALLITNPNLKDFQNHARDKYGEEVKAKLLDEPLSALGAGLAHLFGELKICRENNYIYSVYYLKISLLGETQTKALAIGIGSFFIPLDKEFVEGDKKMNDCENALNFVQF